MNSRCTKKDFSDDVREFVVSNFLFGAAPLQDDTSFLDSGTVDSMGVLELVVFLEKSYNVKITTGEITPDNLDSINRVAHFLMKKLGVGAEGNVLQAAIARPAEQPAQETKLFL